MSRTCGVCRLPMPAGDRYCWYCQNPGYRRPSPPETNQRIDESRRQEVVDRAILTFALLLAERTVSDDAEYPRDVKEGLIKRMGELRELIKGSL